MTEFITDDRHPETLFVSTLTSDTQINGVINGRMHPHVRPQDGDFPAIVYSYVRDAPYSRLNGQATLSKATISIDCIAETYPAAKDLAELVRTKMENRSDKPGTLGPSVHVVLWRNTHSFYEPPPDGDSIGIFRVILDFDVTYANLSL